MIIWLTGNSGSGKTTLAYSMRREDPSWVVLDGNEMRNSISLGAGFSPPERHEHNLRVARLAAILELQGHKVIVAVIAPFAETRRRIDDVINVVWVYLKRDSLAADPDRPYEPPFGVTTFDTDTMSIAEEVRELRKLTKWT